MSDAEEVRDDELDYLQNRLISATPFIDISYVSPELQRAAGHVIRDLRTELTQLRNSLNDSRTAWQEVVNVNEDLRARFNAAVLENERLKKERA